MTRSVVVGIDGSRESLVAGEWAAKEAALRRLPLRLVHATPAPARDDPTELPVAFSWRRTDEDVIRRVETDLAARYPHVAISGLQVADAAATALLSASETAELLVVGARGEGGFNGLTVGSTALATASAASCAVAIVPQNPAAVAHGVVSVGVDVRRVADPPLDFAFSAAQLRGVRLHAVYAWALSGASPSTLLGVPEEDRGAWEDEEVQRLSDALDVWQDKYPEVSVLPDVVLMHPAYALVHASQRADLLVLGRRSSLRRAERRLGPVAHAVLHHSHCPVVVVPHV
ncbi:universal stress protein [Streptomyces silvisoli]|uniref:Universal stress protein n=1 Tax=Streptomyces silvisoli TaxID=3034235 RepID=A0ABT5ZSH4_9ACTN|nr:universal stress protein [Streptomyces silvisoli]MDF3292596.1 universal stress protein [Streptomyces silvisoli]